MKCTYGHENPADAKFCVVCGLAMGAPTAPPQPDLPVVAPAYPTYPAPNAYPGGVRAGGLPPQNGMGTAALVCGILGVLICGLASVLAVIFGFQGIAKANQGLATNKGSATAGLVLGFIGVGIWLIAVLVLASSGT